MKDRKARWREVLKPTGPGRKFVYTVHYPVDRRVPWARLSPDQKAARIEWSWENYGLRMAHAEAVDDDFLPCLSVSTGTEIYAEALGCKVYRPEDNNPMAIPFVHTAAEAAGVKLPKLEDSPLMLLFEIADELKRRGGKDALLSLPDVQSPMDIVAQVWDKTDLFVAMIDEPQAVKDLAAKAQHLLQSFLDEWFARYGNSEFIAHHPDYYMPGGVTMSVDEIGNVSSDMFVEFFLQELNELSDRYGGIGIHCCARSEHQWQNLAAVHNLRLLNLYQPQPVIDRAYQFFTPQTAHWHAGLVNGVPAPLRTMLLSEYPDNCRAVIVESAKSLEEARVLAGRFREQEAALGA